jgi:polyisoprenoid-binding protein YceI
MTTHIGAPSLTSTRWRIEPTRSSVEFAVKNFWGLMTVKGHFTRYQGTLDLGAQPAIELVLQADSLVTYHAKRDTHLRSPDFFDVAAHPYVRFVSERAVLDGETLAVEGHLHARGTSIPLSLEATVRHIGDELVIEAVTTADHRQLGMTWNTLGMIRTPAALTVKGRLVPDR